MGTLKFEKTGSFLSPVKMVAMITLLEHELTDDMVKELGETLDQIEGDSALRAVLLTAEGDKFVQGSASGGAKDLLNRLIKFKLPVLGIINGNALDAGFDLALACDWRYTSESVELGWPGADAAFSTEDGDKLLGEITLDRLPGGLRGKQISAEEAKKAGIINKVMPADELLSTAKFTATKCADSAPIAVRGAKRTLSMAFSVSIEEGNKAEVEVCALCADSEDLQEGVAAIFAKRKPRFSDK